MTIYLNSNPGGQILYYDNETIFALDGDETVFISGAGNTVLGGLGNDTLVAIAGANNILNGGDGNDTLQGSTAATSMFGNAGDDRLTGYGGNDILDGGTGGDAMWGGGGDDIFYVDSANDFAIGGDGFDTVYSTAALTYMRDDVEKLVGTLDSGQQLEGNMFDNIIMGGAGNDTINSNAGNDTVYGGAGDDTYIVVTTTTTIIENADEGIDTVNSYVATYTLAEGGNVENLRGIGGQNFVFTGNSDDNVITGNEGNDTLTGGGGNDTLDSGGGGNDTLTGGTGDDTYIVSHNNQTVVEQADEGIDTVKTATFSYTLGSNLENLVGTLATGQELIGNELNNSITGGNGNDAIDGSTGDDTMAGGLGNDTYVVDSYYDQVVENTNSGIDTIKTGLGYYSLSGTVNVENLTSTSADGHELIGNELSNTITGNSGNDILNGMGGADTLIGGGGDDQYEVDSESDVVIEANGSTGFDVVLATSASYTLSANIEQLEGRVGVGESQSLTGNDIDNVIYGAEGANSTINGGAGNDTLSASGDGNNDLHGGNGNDSLEANGLGINSLSGDAGDDTYYVYSETTSVNELANAGTDTVNTSLATYTLANNFENLNGFATSGGPARVIFAEPIDQTLTGNALDNIIRGGSGNDTLNGGDGADTLYTNPEGQLWNDYGFDTLNGDAGNDTLRAMDNNDTLNGGAGDDVLIIGDANYGGEGQWGGSGNTLNGGDGNDTLTSYSRGEGNTLNGEAGDDTFFALGSYETYYGGEGNDVFQITSNGYGNEFIGGIGNDTYNIQQGVEGFNIVENADGGIDTITAASGSVYLDEGNNNIENAKGIDSDYAVRLYGNNLDNELTGNAQSDYLSGGNGNDRLDGGAGADEMHGGAGDDTYVIDNYADTVDETDGDDNDAGGSDTIITSLTNISLASFTFVENIIINGEGAHSQTGNDLNNTFNGNASGDSMSGGGGNDDLNGAAGDDFLDGGEGNDALDGGNDDDTLLGGAGDDNLTGGSGDDTLRGGAGNDYLDGGAGGDIMAGGAGDDTYVVDSTEDVVVEGGNGGVDSVNTTLFTYTLGNNFENLTSQNDDKQKISLTEMAGALRGNALDNTIDGSNHSEYLLGEAGDDTLYGNVGNDVLRGGAGADLLDGGTGTDRATYHNSTGVHVSLDGVANETGDAEGDTFVSIENLTGSDTGADVLSGSAGANSIWGQGGNDTLNGKGGIDILSGGKGKDHFVFGNVKEGGDHIVDFNRGDSIDLSGAAFGKLKAGALDATMFQSGIGHKALTAEAHFLFDTKNGQLWFDADGNKAGAAKLILDLDTHYKLSALDIHII